MLLPRNRSRATITTMRMTTTMIMNIIMVPA